MGCVVTGSKNMPTVVIYTSSASSDLAIKKHQQSLKFLLDKKKVAYTESDLASMEKGARDAVYQKAGARTIPLLFVNDSYIGGYEKVQELEEDEQLTGILNQWRHNPSQVVSLQHYILVSSW